MEGEKNIISGKNQENLYNDVIVGSLLDAEAIDNNKPIDLKGREKSLADIELAEEAKREVQEETAIAKQEAKINESLKRKAEEQLKLEKVMKELNISDEPINFKRIKRDDILEAFGNLESQENIGFEKVTVNGKEIMLSRKTSEPITYAEALKWCADDSGRLPTIEELKALYESNKADSFEGKVIWSSSMRLNVPQVFDFTHGRIELRNKEDAVNATRAVADIN